MRNSSVSETAVYTIRIEREKLEQLRKIAELEHRTLVSKLRVMIEREIATDALKRSAA